ncbi:MAG: sigma 54-interacting transcriptional regulator [Myxococcales bacterium]
MAYLHFQRRGLPLMLFELRDEVTTVGSRARVSLPDPELAPVELEIEGAEESFRLADRSGKGVLVNGRRVQEARLGDRDEITLGDCSATFRLGGPEAPADDYGDPTLPQHRDRDRDRLPAALWIGAEIPGEPQSWRELPLGESLEIGSAAEAGLRLASPEVSARHARVSRAAGMLLVQDRESTNGTWYQAGRIREMSLPVGARFKVGPWECWVSAERRQEQPKVELFEGMLSGDPVMHALFREIEAAAPSGVRVVIHGESGTGKELVAQAVHRRSDRARGPFVSFNCGRLRGDLAASELFGHVKGAFSGAVAARKGKFELADGGTLFLDEIADLPPEVQVQLLRTLQEGEVEPVGGERKIQVNVRVITASHRPLPVEVRAGRFRADLRYRLDGVRLEVVPLRERRGDVLALWEHFVRPLRPRDAPALGPAAEQALLAHPWPGNVRELETTVHRALYRSAGRAVIEPGDLLLDEGEPALPLGQLVDTKGRTLAQIEAAVVEAKMRALHGNRSAAARELDIDYKTLLKKLRDYGLAHVGRDGEKEP